MARGTTAEERLAARRLSKYYEQVRQRIRKQALHSAKPGHRQESEQDVLSI